MPYSDVLIDRLPSLNLLTLNALVAADAVLVPVQRRVLRSGGRRPARSRTVDQIKATLDPALEIEGVGARPCTMRAAELSKEVAADVAASSARGSSRP